MTTSQENTKALNDTINTENEQSTQHTQEINDGEKTIEELREEVEIYKAKEKERLIEQRNEFIRREKEERDRKEQEKKANEQRTAKELEEKKIQDEVNRRLREKEINKPQSFGKNNNYIEQNISDTHSSENKSKSYEEHFKQILDNTPDDHKKYNGLNTVYDYKTYHQAQKMASIDSLMDAVRFVSKK